ncbi:MAG TPA: L,D-transpeptidase family protein [Chthoniobacterales bacterium]|jgi:L,D-transpeptidase catalytic domain|nr:L,D-transpeptidase family protein [Chthoniobacterales bacterium]
MLPSLIAFCLLLHSSSPELARQAAVFRQNQLADAVLANDRPAMLTAIDAHANLNSPIVLTPERLTALARVSTRLDHYFREESKATPLILAAALGEKELCTVLVGRGAERFRASAWGWVPAQYAARCGFPELASTLIESDPLATHFNIKIELSPQMVILYKDGLALVKGKISTGKPGFDTPPGHYLVTDKERERRSSIYKVSMPYFLRLSFSEYGIHEGHDPGRPASHGCIRVAEENVAKAIFDQTPIGTLVDIE